MPWFKVDDAFHAAARERCSGCVGYDEETRDCPGHEVSALDWIVVGGESGPNARPFDLAWGRSALAQCAMAGVPAFFKQAGARPMNNGVPLRLRDRKGGDLTELPIELRERRFP